MPKATSAAEPPAASLLTPDEVAQWLHISKKSVYRLIQRRAIRFYRLSGCLRLDRVDVEAFMLTSRFEPLG